MAHYRKIDPRIWNDEKFQSFSDDGKLAFLFILTHPSMTALGAMRATIPGLAAEIRWQLGRFDKFRDALPDGIWDAFADAIRDGKSDARRIQEQEQDQEQPIRERGAPNSLGVSNLVSLFRNSVVVLLLTSLKMKFGLSVGRRGRVRRALHLPERNALSSRAVQAFAFMALYTALGNCTGRRSAR